MRGSEVYMAYLWSSREKSKQSGRDIGCPEIWEERLQYINLSFKK